MTLSRFKVHDKPGTPTVPGPPIANAALGTEVATINAILAALRNLGLINP